MRTLGCILGTIFLADGLTALLGGRQALQWMQDAVTPIVPGTWQDTMTKFTNIDDQMRTIISYNQIIAGTGMILVALGASCPKPGKLARMEAPAA